MAAQYNPKTLAKTLSYIGYHAPAEYGLFWDSDGTMPWKELYWALQEDPSLRFVREGIIRELVYLGLELPFVIEGSLLRLQAGLDLPCYPLVDNVPERLYFACRRKQYVILSEHGIVASHRPYVPVSANKELSVRLAQRRDPEPVLVEIRAAKARSEGQPILWAGAELYLVQAIPVSYLVFPLMRAERHASSTARKKVAPKPSRPNLPASAGSFFVDAHHVHPHSPATDGVGVDNGVKQKGRKKTDWKRESKKERHKRTL
jgi:putative RNA 2'-phosphotransferase